MPASNFAKTSESSVFFEKVGPWTGGALAGLLIGFGIGNYVTMETGIVEATNNSLCNIGFESRCDVIGPEAQGSPLGTMVATLALGGLVAIAAGIKPEQNRAGTMN